MVPTFLLLPYLRVENEENETVTNVKMLHIIIHLLAYIAPYE